jgi:hypothetical protein
MPGTPPPVEETVTLTLPEFVTYVLSGLLKKSLTFIQMGVLIVCWMPLIVGATSLTVAPV